jgi:hypothetical protein
MEPRVRVSRVVTGASDVAWNGSSSESSQEKRRKKNKIGISNRSRRGMVRGMGPKKQRIRVEMKKGEYPARNSRSRSRSLALTRRTCTEGTAHRRIPPSYIPSLCLYPGRFSGAILPFSAHITHLSPSHSVCPTRGYQTSPIARG